MSKLLVAPLTVTCTCAAVALLSVTLAAAGPGRSSSGTVRGLAWAAALVIALLAACAGGFALSTALLTE